LLDQNLLGAPEHIHPRHNTALAVGGKAARARNLLTRVLDPQSLPAASGRCHLRLSHQPLIGIFCYLVTLHYVSPHVCCVSSSPRGNLPVSG
jgi:hypothetical protein